MRVRAVQTVVLGALFVGLVMSVYLAILPTSFFKSRSSHQDSNQTRAYLAPKPWPLGEGRAGKGEGGAPKERGGAEGTGGGAGGERGSWGGVEDEAGAVEAAKGVAGRTGAVLFTMVNDAFFPFTASWLCNTAPFRGLHPRVLVLTTDLATGRRLKQLWPNVTVAATASSHFSGVQEYSRAGYVRMMVERTRFIRRLLEARVRILLFEVDALWLSDPVPELLARRGEADIFATKVSGQNVVAGGFLLLNPTPATVKLWGRLTEKMEGLQRKLESKRDSVPVSESLNDQQFLTSLILKKFAGVKVTYLPANLYPDGKWYKKSATQRSTTPLPIVINNNWVIGDAAKISRAKAFGHWFWDDGKVACNSTALRNLFT